MPDTSWRHPLRPIAIVRPDPVSAVNRFSTYYRRSFDGMALSYGGGICNSVAARPIRTGILSTRRQHATDLLESQARLDAEPADLAVADAHQLGDLGLGPAVIGALSAVKVEAERKAHFFQEKKTTSRCRDYAMKGSRSEVTPVI